MSIPTPGAERGPDPRPEQTSSRPPAGEPRRRERPADQSGGPPERPEPDLGGADAIEKTTYVVGDGTDPDAPPTGAYVARDAAGQGSVVAWVVGGIAALIALVYAIGIFL
jgi:hypothetical protein